MKPIWVVDDDQSIRFVLEKALQREQFAVRTFANPRDVIKALADDAPQVLVSDIRMPGGSGIDLLAEVKARLPGLPVIIMTAYSDLDSAVSAFQGGAFEYLPKPFDVTAAVDLIRRAVDESLREEVADAAPVAAPEMLGQAPAMQDVFRAIGRLSQSQVTVLITGESGTGKELVAQALHKHSPRGEQGKSGGAGGPFIAINTAAIPKDLLESELFGHERGAFTGAQTTRRGRFEQADGGTLFLDEIGDMPFDLQTRLLRVLSDGQFYRVGGHQPLKSNVRVIAATHQNLEERVRQGGFREDLFHRLNVIRLRLPALRERREDIPMLARFFMAKSARELGVDTKRITDAALLRLASFDFPGNVRQLENLCHWLTVMALGTTSRIALEYLRAFPDHVDAAVLDSPEWPGVDPYVESIKGTRHAVSELSAACTADPMCRRFAPNFEGDVAKVYRQLDAHPFLADYGPQGRVLLDAGWFAAWLRQRLAFTRPPGTDVPYIVHRFALGSKRFLRREATKILVRQLCQGFLPNCWTNLVQGLGLYLTVMCRDVVPFTDSSGLAAIAGDAPGYREAYVRGPFTDVCSAWDAGRGDPQVATPVSSDVPALVIVGRFDPFGTAPEAVAGAATLAASHVVIAAVNGHEVTGTEQGVSRLCMVRVRDAWLDDPSATPDDSCQQHVSFSYAPVLT